MSYHVYTTKALILRGASYGEADKQYLLFTQDLGLIFASAKSVRLVTSKLNPALQDFSFSTVSLVRGKQSWKITNALCEESVYDLFRDKKVVLTMLARVASLLVKIVAGEEKNETLFLTFTSAVDFLRTNMFTTENLSTIESILVLRILHNLGYVASRDEYSVVLGSAWNNEVLENASVLKISMIRDINRALKESHLS